MTSSSSNPARARRPPLRGDVWLADLDPVRGREQAGRRPVLVVSADGLNRSGRGLVIVVPITSHMCDVISQAPIRPPDGGLGQPSVAMCEQIRSITVERLQHRIGAVSRTTLLDVAQRLAVVLALPAEEQL